MLGRQQIAGIPTAISELFKNAYDAYADNAIADFIRHRNIFVLRDDGIGMTREEFVERWLTLGTESKLGEGSLLPPPVDAEKAVRPILGEKGIGRLAIASIGPQVLILSRSKCEGVDGAITAAFINWTLFECPGITLDDIEVPIESIRGATVRRADVLRLVDVVRRNVADLRPKLGGTRADAIVAQLDQFDVSPSRLAEQLGAPSFTGGGHGVHFYITPTDPSLAAGLGRDVGSESPELQRLLLGFNNTMVPGHAPPPLTVEFFDHRVPGAPAEELIGPRVFFTEDDFRRADHHISGRFDEYGQFEGTVTVYSEPSQPYRVAWPRAMGSPTACGPFRLNVAYVQGVRADSRLDPEAFAQIGDKLGRWGGVYVYRDGVRVLPYGSADNDWLEIESNRTKSASYYFFSYRRMLGAVETTRAQNERLEEKAGREGFRQNEAYREFVAILKNFFPQLVADFFREDSKLSATFALRRAELNKIEEARRKREAQVRSRRAGFRAELEGFFQKVSAGEPERCTAELLAELRSGLDGAGALPNAHDAANALVDAEQEARRKLGQLRDAFHPTRPRGIPLARDLQRDTAAMRTEVARLEHDVFVPAAEEIERAALGAVTSAQTAIDRRVRFDRSVTAAADDARQRTRSLAQSTRFAAEATREVVITLAQTALREVEDRATAVLADAASVDVSTLDDQGIVAVRMQLEAAIEETSTASQQLLEAIRARLETLAAATDPAEWSVSPEELTAAVEEELLELREKSEADLELAQLGMAIEIINHEFEATIRAIRVNIGELKEWAAVNAGMRPLYSGIRNSFEHLDGYLRLFTPLHKRLQRSAIDVAGADIARFLQDLFKERFQRHEVSLISTDAFERFKVRGYPSTFYPVFVNVVDNAVFWLDRRHPPREVRLDATDGAMLITDTGQGVDGRDREAVFELGFTRKPGGRGLGLYISRQVLRRAGWDIDVVDAGSGSAFRIAPSSSEDGKRTG
jgi:signal transduction histidine kinase